VVQVVLAAAEAAVATALQVLAVLVAFLCTTKILENNK
jgi:hypothetical protein